MSDSTPNPAPLSYRDALIDVLDGMKREELKSYTGLPDDRIEAIFEARNRAEAEASAPAKALNAMTLYELMHACERAGVEFEEGGTITRTRLISILWGKAVPR